MFEQYYQDIRWLESLQNMPRSERLLRQGESKIFLQRLEKFLALVGNPHTKSKVIHIAGTAGKGSTTKILHDLIAAAGYKVGAYTSPHSTVAIEKVIVNGQFISPAELHAMLRDIIKPAFDKYLKLYGEPISYFETWTVIALLYFVQKKCDWVILETGLGGTHDSTNIIPRPIVTAITNIGLDHMEILGNTKEKIARDKAGIIKKGCYFLTSEQSLKLKKIMQTQVRKSGAKYVELKNLTAGLKLRGFFSTGRQQKNLNLALNILETIKIKPVMSQKLINNFRFICRQEIVSRKPLVVVDGSHNPDKLKSLLKFVESLKYNNLYLIVGFAQDKHFESTLKQLLPLAKQIYLTRSLVVQRKTADLHQLLKFANKYTSKKTSLYSDPWDALGAVLPQVKKNDLLLITGSFYIAGELRQHWISKDFMLKNRREF